MSQETEFQSKAVALIDNWRKEPTDFLKTFFDSKLWEKQEEIVHSVRDNKKTAVKSCNSGGKTAIAARIALWFLATHYPSKVITTAPTFLQVEKILWKEIATLYRTSRYPIGGDLLNTELKLNDEWFALGIATDEVNRMQGFKSPYLLVILDEALGINPRMWEAIEGLLPYRVLALGNPLEATGEFHRCFESELWNCITINGRDCIEWQKKNGKIDGLITEEWLEERKRDWGENSPLFQARCLGEFPEESTDILISRKWVDDCRNNTGELNENEEDFERVVSCDVATKHGENETVVQRRYGHTIPFIKGYQQIPITKSASILQETASDFTPITTVVDADGIGEGLSDILQQANLPVTEFHGGYGQKAVDSMKFRNLRSQFYYVIAKKFEKRMYDLSKLPQKEYEILKSQLCCIKVKKPDALGRFQIETKDDLIGRSISSPDYADTFMMGEFGYYMSKFADIEAYSWR